MSNWAHSLIIYSEKPIGEDWLTERELLTIEIEGGVVGGYNQREGFVDK